MGVSIFKVLAKKQRDISFPDTGPSGEVWAEVREGGYWLGRPRAALATSYDAPTARCQAHSRSPSALFSWQREHQLAVRYHSDTR
jgi:hypothetical protein